MRHILLVVAVLVLVVAGVLVHGPLIRLDRMRPSLEATAADALGRELEIRGDLGVTLSFWPTLVMRRVRIGNPEGFSDDDFAHLGEVRAQVALLPLLRGDLRIGELAVEGARIELETTAGGRNNWAFATARGSGVSEPTQEAGSGVSEPTQEAEADGGAPLEIRSLVLRDVRALYREGSRDRDYRLGIRSLRGSLAPEALRLVVSGDLNGRAYELKLRSDHFLEIWQAYEPFDLELSGRLAGVPVVGRGRLDVKSRETSLELHLQASDAEIGELAEWLTGREDVEGRVGRLDVRANTIGADLGQWVEAAEVDLQLVAGALSYGNAAGARPVGFSVADARLGVGPGGPLRGRASGALLGVPARLDVEGGRLAALLAPEPWPLRIEGSGAGAQLRLEGVRSSGGSPHRFRLELDADRVGELAPWLGVPEGAPAALHVRGDLELAARGFRLSNASFGLGRTRAEGALAWLAGDGSSRPVLDLRIATLDAGELGDNLVGEQDADEPAAPGLTLDSPILPEAIRIASADLDVRVARLFGDPTDVTDIAFSVRLRGGRADDVPLAARYAGVGLRGELDLDLGSAVPTAELQLATGEVDLGRVARALGLASDLQARARRLSLGLQLRGRTTRELLSESSFLATAEDGYWKVDADLLDTGLDFQRVTLQAESGGAVVSEFSGELRAVPVSLRLELPSLIDLAVPDQVFPARASAESKGARLDLDLRLRLPVERAEGDVAFELTGERVADLGPLLGVSLPPFGPYAIRGVARGHRGKAYATTVDVRVRETQVSGDVRIDATGRRPAASVSLEAAQIQLADFEYDGWSPSRGGRPRDTGGGAATEPVDPILSHTVLQGFDAELRVEVGEVRSGADSLGRGRLQATVRDGRLVVDPLQLGVPGGEVIVALQVEPGPDEVQTAFRAQLERFDYGILARRINPEARTRGRVDLDVDVRARGPDLASLAPGADGWIEFAAVPEDMSATAFNFWGLNLLNATIRLLNPVSRSRVNCMVGAFGIEAGFLESRALLIDTTDLQIHGAGHVDFGTRDLRFEFRPRPKQIQVLGLAVPVVAEGTLTDFRTRLRPGGPIRGLVRQGVNAVRMPFERLLGRGLAADGHSACWSALEAARDAR